MNVFPKEKWKSFLFVERKLYMKAFVVLRNLYGDKLNDGKFREKTKLLFHKN